MDFFENFCGSFLIYMLIFVVIMAIALGIGIMRRKKKEKGFRSYLTQHFPSLQPDHPMLVAKSKSKSAKPDIALVIDEASKQVIIMHNISGSQIVHHAYPAADLKSVKRHNQMLSRGFAPPTYSYEESLELLFGDGIFHYLYLENISNKSGTDKGAEVVRQMLNPWYAKLNAFLQENTPR